MLALNAQTWCPMHTQYLALMPHHPLQKEELLIIHHVVLPAGVAPILYPLRYFIAMMDSTQQLEEDVRGCYGDDDNKHQIGGG